MGVEDLLIRKGKRRVPPDRAWDSEVVPEDGKKGKTEKITSMRTTKKRGGS